MGVHRVTSPVTVPGGTPFSCFSPLGSFSRVHVIWFPVQTFCLGLVQNVLSGKIRIYVFLLEHTINKQTEVQNYKC